jgi:excisionase family DNA binding protein
MTRHSKSLPSASLGLVQPDRAARGSHPCPRVAASWAAFGLSPKSAPSPPIDRLAPEQLLTVSEVAGRLAVSEKTIRRWIAAGSLPAVRLGRLVRVSSKLLIEFIQLNESSRHE